MVVAEYIPGWVNGAVDALSRDCLSQLRLQVPTAADEAMVIPPELLDMLVYSRPDWTSQSWREQFRGTLQRV